MSSIETDSVSAPDATSAAPASGQANGGFERWIKDFQKYESILADITKATAEAKFKDELGTIEHWFKVLSESERTAALYSLLATSTQDQARFFIAVLQQKIQPEEPPKSAVSTTPQQSPAKPRLSKLVRPPSLNLPDLGSPTTPTPNTARERESAVDEEQSHHSLLAQAAMNREAQRKAAAAPPTGDTLANLVNTPLIPLFQKDKEGAAGEETKTGHHGGGGTGSTASLPGFSGINPYTLNMLASAGLSNEAQLLAAQLVMSGLVQPTALLQDKAKPGKKGGLAGAAAWRNTPTSARYPASALRSSGLRPNSSLKSPGLAGLKSGVPQSATVPPMSAVDSPREEDFKPEMLDDIPGWLRTLRLHKYTQCFEGLGWQEMVCLDDAALEGRGVAALGARRRLLRTFEHVRRVMGLEGGSAETPTTASIASSKLSINSPAFTPKGAVIPAVTESVSESV